MEQDLVCRTCLCVVGMQKMGFGYLEDSLRDMLMFSLPEIDLYASPSPVICVNCIQLLITMYNFKTTCINTENVVQSYLQFNSQQNLSQINLKYIVHDLIVKGFYFRNMNSTPDHHQALPRQQTFGNGFSKQTNTISRPLKSDKIETITNALVPEQLSQTNLECKDKTDEAEKVTEKKVRLIVRIDRSRINVPLKEDKAVENECLTQTSSLVCDSKTTDVEMKADSNENSLSDGKQEVYSEKNDVFRETMQIERNDGNLRNNGYLENKSPHLEENTQNSVKYSNPPPTENNNQMLYECNRCSYVTTNPFSYARHDEECSTDSAKVYKCDECPFANAHRLAVAKHKLKHAFEAHECPFCHDRIKDKCNFRKHLFMHSKEVLTCAACHYRCTSPYHMRSHARKFHQGLNISEIDCRSDHSLEDLIGYIADQDRRFRKGFGGASEG